ncbi:MAG: lipocalin [Paracoccaceae bacterium]
MHRLILCLALMLAACAQPAAQGVSVFRPKAAPIWSAAAFDASRLDGRWQQVAAFSASDSPGCAPGAVEFRGGPGGLDLAGSLCLNGQKRSFSGPVQMTGPGRLAVPGMADWWVIWVDSGYRTLAIGTPDGSFGFVLDRGRTPPDRLRAAAEIFDFNGYAKGRFQPF